MSIKEKYNNNNYDDDDVGYHYYGIMDFETKL